MHSLAIVINNYSRLKNFKYPKCMALVKISKMNSNSRRLLVAVD